MGEANNNADVLPFIEQLGPVPAALQSYEDFDLKRSATGLSVALKFNRQLSPAEKVEVGDYCAAAFNLLGFKGTSHSSAPHHGTPESTVLTLRTAHDNVPSNMRVMSKHSENQGDTLEPIDSLGHRWKALRTIRQAALLA